ncbi:Asp-tRNA(Asn)/Glu-tRNA(Gln) amidotransferase subunit GatC [Desulfurivibrio sp. D14AmB]|uniref:Asp-tRNA(Asn)/Glu-tRNA(Gln) amidotransferase subunit GatC n=1 Tax=Desulfurivibrio sp. D14AmB TaxID=3374370 RepID=UPI00376EACD8
MRISEEQVMQVARLARLELAADEVGPLTGQLDKILQYVDKLNELDTSAVAPVTHALSVVNAFREDEVVPSLPRAEALANAPLATEAAFVVPKVI